LEILVALGTSTRKKLHQSRQVQVAGVLTQLAMRARFLNELLKMQSPRFNQLILLRAGENWQAVIAKILPQTQTY
jgi:hypothetical protein